MSLTDETELASALTRHPQVEDAVVLERSMGSEGRRLVAYLVTGRASAAAEVVAEVAKAGAAGGGPIGVPVSCVPLGPDGRLDAAALEAVPVLDDAALRAWDAEAGSVAAAAGAGGAVAVVPVEWSPPAPRVHLSEVAPESWGAAAGTIGTAETVEAAPAPRPGRAAAPAAPSISHGDPLRPPADAPRTLLDTLRRAAERSTDRSLRYVGRDLTLDRQSYAELLADAERVLGGLRRLGLVPGDRVLLQLREHRDFLGALWGCMLGGIVPVPVSIAPAYHEPNAVTQKLAAAWEMLGRPLVLASPDLVADVQSLGARLSLEGFRVASIEALRAEERDGRWHAAAPGDVALIMLTSGSTGTPKGVKLTHASLVARSLGSEQMNAFTRDEVTLNWMPLDHVAGILFFHLRDVYLGCDQIHAPTDVILGDPLRWMDLIHQHRCTITFAPNFAYGLVNDRAEQIRERAWDLSSLRCFLNGAEAIVARTARRFLELLIPHGLAPGAMWPAWGMSETSSGVTYSDRFSLERVRDTDSFVEVGRPIPGVSLRVVDDDGRVVPEGATGNLEVSGTTLMAGYYDASLDAEAFTSDGWFKTGDLALIRDGRMTITGRAKDVIIVNSVNYYSHELESVVEEVPGVATSFAAACPVRAPGDDTDRLAIVFHAEVAGDAELLEVLREIRQRCLRQVGVNPDYLIPVEKADIPKTEIGKIQRPLLAQRFAAGAFDTQRRRVDLLLGERSLPSWFFAKRWVRSERRRASAGGAGGTWVVFVDRAGLGDTVCDELRRGGERALAVEQGTGALARLAPDRWSLDPSDPTQYARLLDEATAGMPPVARTVHLWTCGEPVGAAAAPADVVRALDRGALSALAWIQALAGASVRAPRVELLAVSSGAQAVQPGERVDGARAALVGLLKSAPQELAWLGCRHLDVAPDAPEATAATVLDEALHGGPEREIAWREGVRLVARLAHAPPDGPPPAEAPVRRGGAYLLTGGLGGIGAEVARELLRRFDARLLLVGRSAADEAALATLRAAGGDVRHALVDVGDEAALRRAVADAETAWGRALDGAFHLAGVYRERALLDETPASFREVLHPKLAGTRALERVLADRPGAFLLGFSSVIAAFGGALVGAYAAANAALEGAIAGAADAPGPRRCASWSTWEDLGISRAFAGGALLRAKGYLPVSGPLGIASTLAALWRPEPVLYVGLDGANPNVRRHLDERACARLGLDVLYTDRAAAGALGALALRDRFGTRVAARLEWRAELPLAANGTVDRAALAEGAARGRADAELESPTSDLEQAIARVWKTTLRRERIDVRDNFFDLGGNSLLLAQASSALSAELRRPVSLTDMFQYSTVRTLALHLGGGGPSPGEELEATISRGAGRAERLRARRHRSRS